MKVVYKTNNSIKVINENGTSKRPKCKCGVWLKHWEKLSDIKSSKCMIEDCNEDATDGAHITRPNAKNEKLKTHSYILPMCKRHNGKHGKGLRTKKNATFVWANISKTCSKKIIIKNKH